MAWIVRVPTGRRCMLNILLMALSGLILTNYISG
jgi:hypothetical protein